MFSPLVFSTESAFHTFRLSSPPFFSPFLSPYYPYLLFPLLFFLNVYNLLITHWMSLQSSLSLLLPPKFSNLNFIHIITTLYFQSLCNVRSVAFFFQLTSVICHISIFLIFRYFPVLDCCHKKNAVCFFLLDIFSLMSLLLLSPLFSFLC